ncbi:MAG: hypothetical protein Q8S55_15240 [Methylococcaceae bacterium]|nr:hypothetical protein [Methylococcaceae bacterium]
MSRFTPVTAKVVELLKQKARKLKTETNISHVKALDEVAKQLKFDHWHHVCEQHKLIEPTETAFFTGLIIAFDIKDALEFDDSDGLFLLHEDDVAAYFCYDDLLREFSESIDDDGIALKALKSKEDIIEEFELYEINDYGFLRFTGCALPNSLDDVLRLVSERSFWPPIYVWFKGTFYDTFSQPALSENGEIVGVRF